MSSLVHFSLVCVGTKCSFVEFPRLILVGNCLREAGAGGSNPLTPTIYPFCLQQLSSVATPLHWNSISQCDWIVTDCRLKRRRHHGFSGYPCVHSAPSSLLYCVQAHRGLRADVHPLLPTRMHKCDEDHGK